MSYTINYLEDKNIVKVKVQYRVSYKVAQKYSIDAIRLAHEYDCNNFLIDHTQTAQEDGIYKIHTDGDALQRFGFNSSDKIAIVISADKNDPNLFETKVSNIKWSNFKYFDNEEKAVLWLNENE